MIQPLHISYFAVLLDGPESGASKKVLSQLETWVDSGIGASLYVIVLKKDLKLWNFPGDVFVYPEGKGFLKLLVRYKVLKCLLKKSPEVIYVRDSFPFPLLNNLKTSKLILEVQTLFFQELESRSRLKWAIAKIFDKYYLNKFSGFIFVSREISYSSRFTKYLLSGNSAVISNGIRLDKFNTLKVNKTNQSIELIFVGQDGQKWHGVEQIISLANQAPDYIFHLVGIAPNQYESPGNVKFYGKLPFSDYKLITERCVAAFGTLNISAKKMTEASPLKVREYLALGLPVIIRYSDTDFMDKSDFILNLPHDNRDLKDFVIEIRNFCETWQGRRVPQDLVREIDMQGKENQRLAFFRKVYDYKS